MSNFIIQKTTTGNFYHIYNNARTKVNVSDFDVVLDDVALTFIIQCKNGSNIPSQAVSINLIQVIDLSVGTSPIPFSGIDELILLLKSISYTPYLQSLIITEPIRIYEVGQVGVFTMTPTQFTDNFDVTGLGRNTMLGWALRNGNNGTKNQQDKFSLNKGASPYDVIGAIGGSANAVLIGHSHEVGSYEKEGEPNTITYTNIGLQEGSSNLYKYTKKKGQANNGADTPSEDGIGKNMPPYLIDVWVERVTALIFSGATGDGEGGSQTWSQTLDNGRNTGGFNPLINDDDAIDFENGSYIARGTDEGTGGNGGIEQTCSIGYKWKWEAGEIYIRDQGNSITRKENARFAPTVNDDDASGFIVDSFWEMYDGTLYKLLNATEGEAVWEIYATNVPTLEQVTDEGNVTSNDLIVRNPDDALKQVVIHRPDAGDDTSYILAQYDADTAVIIGTSNGQASINGQVYNEVQNDTFELTPFYFSVSNQLNFLTFQTGILSIGKVTGFPSIQLMSSVFNLLLKTDLITANRTQQYPDKDGTFAMLDDVTGVPYTGATQDVNLGEFGLLTGNIEFDNTPTNIPTTAGSMVWNDPDGTVDLKLKGGNVTLQIGQENVLRVVNKTATNINLLEANYQAVRVTGAQGQRLKVDLAQATTDALSAETIGLVTETINNNQEGFITTSGLIRNVNTTGSLQSETWADGDILYLSPTVAGQITKVKPTAPNHLVIVGYVVHAHATQGSIFVKVDNGYELNELHNVKITSETNNQALVYTSATDIWENKTIIEDAIVNAVTDKAPSQNAVFDALAFTRQLITKGTGSVTGTLTETILTSLTIPANTLDASCFIWSTMDFFKTNAGSVTARLYINSSNTLTGATLLGLVTIGSSRNVSFNRKFLLNGTSLDLLTANTASTQINNEFVEALFGASTVLTINPTANIFLIYTTQNDSVGTVGTNKMATVQKMKL